MCETCGMGGEATYNSLLKCVAQYKGAHNHMSHWPLPTAVMCRGVRTPKCDERDAALRWLQRETYRDVRSSAKATSSSTKRLLLALILRQAPDGFGGSHPS